MVGKGGVAIVIASVIGYGAAHLATLSWPTWSGVLVLFLMVGLGAVGRVDDYIKAVKQRGQGLPSGAKLAGLLIVGIAFAWLVLQFPNEAGTTPAGSHLSFLRDVGPSIGTFFFIVWVLLLIGGYSITVSLIEGLDGRVVGTVGLVLGIYVFIGGWQRQNACSASLTPSCYFVRDPLDLAVVAAAAFAACFGFLWWSASRARISLGSTGSLALGGALVGLAITTRTALLLALLGGLAAILQVGFFYLARFAGRRWQWAPGKPDRRT